MARSGLRIITLSRQLRKEAGDLVSVPLVSPFSINSLQEVPKKEPPRDGTVSLGSSKMMIVHDNYFVEMSEEARILCSSIMLSQVLNLDKAGKESFSQGRSTSAGAWRDADWCGE